MIIKIFTTRVSEPPKSKFEYEFLDKIGGLDISLEENYDKIINFGIQYVVAFKNLNNNTIYPYFITAYGHFYSNFLYSLNVLVPILHTDNFIVFEL